MKDWIEIFKAGTHTDSAGNTKTFTEKDLDRIVDSYDPAKHEAPVVIGHPKDNAPAWAWVQGIKRIGQKLFYREKDSQPEFDDMRKRGLFKKRSISLYPDGTLRHIGWLGANPPAIKGLADVAFSDDGSMTIEFSDGGAASLSRPNKNREEEHKMSFWDRLKKKLTDAGVSFSDLFGSETPPVLYTEADMKTKIDTAVAEAVKTKQAEFSEAASKKEKELNDREEALRKKETDTRKSGIASFTEDLKKKGILTPAMEKLGMGITSFLDAIASIETTFDFAEAGDKGHKDKQTPLEFMQAFLSGLPKAIEFGEVAGAGKETQPVGGTAGEKLDSLTKAKMKEKKDLGYSQAFSEVQSENPELAAEYAEELAG